MKKIISLLILTFLYFDIALAQPNTKAKRIDEIKIEFISKKLSLDADEEEKFIPIYRSYQKEFYKLLQQKKAARSRNANDPEKSVDEDFKYEYKMLELKKRYKQQFREVLTPEQLKTLYQAERGFREELIKQLKQKK